MQEQPHLNNKDNFLNAVKSLIGLPAQTVFYGSALLAIAIQGGFENLPPALITLGTTLGVNALSSMLERIAQGENVSNDEIRKTIQEAISSSNIDELVTSNEFQRVVARVFRQFDLLNYAIQRGEHNIAGILGDQFSKYDEIFKEFKDDLSDIREEIRNINTSLQDLTKQVAASQVPVEFVDEKIQTDLNRLQRCRFFSEFDREGFAITFAEKLLDGVFSHGTPSVRSKALAWCARILSVTVKLAKSEEYLSAAKKLEINPECEIAGAFIISQQGEKSKAVNTLNQVASPVANSAAFMIVNHHDGGEAAVQWLETAEIEFANLDSDGKYFLLAKLLEINRLDIAYTYLRALNNNDFHNQPSLYHLVAIIHLSKAIPFELRPAAIHQVPFDAGRFPLDASLDGLFERREAHRYFSNAVEIERQLGLKLATSLAEEYALWLELRDPEAAVNGRKKLENKLRGNEVNLRFVPLGLQFGIPLDMERVETEIQRQVALNGGNTYETATTQFALAFVRKTPEDAANYIDLHFNTLSQFITKKFIYFNLAT